MSYLTEKQLANNFLYGQLELYKIEFSETGDNKYLEVMNNFNKTLNTLKKMDELIQRLSKENAKK